MNLMGECKIIKIYVSEDSKYEGHNLIMHWFLNLEK